MQATPSTPFTAQPVTLAQILQAREDRVMLQQKLLNTYGGPLISFTMNIAGPVKTSPLIERAFAAGLDVLDKALGKAWGETSNKLLSEKNLRFRSTEISVTGCQAMYCVDLPAQTLKNICVTIEESTPLGRLFDMDVLDGDGKKLERDASVKDRRGCIVCGAPGRACAAGRLHTVAQLQAATRSIIADHFARADAEHIASLAVQSLLDEVYTTPKPGLVDRRNNGSHTDMDISTFLASAHALKPYFQECVTIGQKARALPAGRTFPALRQAGLTAEQTMFRATGGVNTHKGIIYTMGILCGSLGCLWTPEHPIAQTEDLLVLCAEMGRCALENDFSSSATPHSSSSPQTPGTSTTGIRLFRELGITGIRGEVAAGLPSVAQISLPAYKHALQMGYTPNDAGVFALLHLIARVTDTNLYRRGGRNGAAYAAGAAQALLNKWADAPACAPPLSQAEALDDAFISRNLSPGGCADLLAVTYFLHALSSGKESRACTSAEPILS